MHTPEHTHIYTHTYIYREREREREKERNSVNAKKLYHLRNSNRKIKKKSFSQIAVQVRNRFVLQRACSIYDFDLILIVYIYIYIYALS